MSLITIYNNNKTKLLHISIWIVYSILLYISNKLTRPDVHYYKIILFLIPIIITFYSNLYILKFFDKLKWIKFIFLFFSVFFCIGLFEYIFLYIFLPWMNVILYKNASLNFFVQNLILGYLQYFLYASLYFYFTDTLNKKKELIDLKEENLLIAEQKFQKDLENSLLIQNELNAQKEKLQYEYAFLRAQINPHFLHNTLNVLFSQALNYSPELADNIQKLSKLMRYSLESFEYESGKVYLKKELEHLQTLLEIHNIRFAGSTSINYEINGELSDQMVPPLSIMTIVENAFKYGNLKDPTYPLVIKIELKLNEIYLYCSNRKKKNNLSLNSTNIGISNLEKRLDVAFKDKYEMITTESDDIYTFELRIIN
jgi:sensor histidine kinase YesM